MTRVGARLLILAAFAAIAGVSAVLPARAAASLSVTSVDCDLHPAQFDVIYIQNSGDAPQDLAGWQLRSDPEASEQMPLAVAGVLDPGKQLIVVAGAHGVTIPSENVYLWTNLEVLRDSGDPADYVKLFDASGSFTSGMNCLGQPLSAAPPGPTPAPSAEQPVSQPASQPAAAPAAARPPAQAKAVPNTGGAPGGSDTSTPGLMVLGAIAVVSGAALVVAGMRSELVAARLTSIEGERRGRRLRSRRSVGQDDSG